MLDVICGDRCGDRARCALKGWMHTPRSTPRSPRPPPRACACTCACAEGASPPCHCRLFTFVVAVDLTVTASDVKMSGKTNKTDAGERLGKIAYLIQRNLTACARARHKFPPLSSGADALTLLRPRLYGPGINFNREVWGSSKSSVMSRTLHKNNWS